MLTIDPTPPPGHARLDGVVKVKLAHGQGFSLLLVDRVYVEDADGWAFLEPAMFGASRMAFRDSGAHAFVDVDTENGDRLLIDFGSDDLASRLPDGSHLYRCSIVGRDDFPARSSGRARRAADGSFELRLYHHTAPATLPLIEASGNVRGSPWNLQGNKRLRNVGYAYLTNRATIADHDDLAAVAMATDGAFGLLLDDMEPPDGIVVIEVTRSETRDRTGTLPLWVADHAVASAHLHRHEQRDAVGIFYEAALPAVFRIGLKPGAVLYFAAGAAMPDPASLQRFDYVVVGDARTVAGIVAPYDEEDTHSICKVEHVATTDLISFWHDNANADLFTGMAVDRQTFKAPA